MSGNVTTLQGLTTTKSVIIHEVSITDAPNGIMTSGVTYHGSISIKNITNVGGSGGTHTNPDLKFDSIDFKLYSKTVLNANLINIIPSVTPTDLPSTDGSSDKNSFIPIPFSLEFPPETPSGSVYCTIDISFTSNVDNIEKTYRNPQESAGQHLFAVKLGAFFAAGQSPLNVGVLTPSSLKANPGDHSLNMNVPVTNGAPSTISATLSIAGIGISTNELPIQIQGSSKQSFDITFDILDDAPPGPTTITAAVIPIPTTDTASNTVDITIASSNITVDISSVVPNSIFQGNRGQFSVNVNNPSSRSLAVQLITKIFTNDSNHTDVTNSFGIDFVLGSELTIPKFDSAPFVLAINTQKDNNYVPIGSYVAEVTISGSGFNPITQATAFSVSTAVVVTVQAGKISNTNRDISVKVQNLTGASFTLLSLWVQLSSSISLTVTAAAGFTIAAGDMHTFTATLAPSQITQGTFSSFAVVRGSFPGGTKPFAFKSNPTSIVVDNPLPNPSGIGASIKTALRNSSEIDIHGIPTSIPVLSIETAIYSFFNNGSVGSLIGDWTNFGFSIPFPTIINGATNFIEYDQNKLSTTVHILVVVTFTTGQNIVFAKTFLAGQGVELQII